MRVKKKMFIVIIALHLLKTYEKINNVAFRCHNMEHHVSALAQRRNLGSSNVSPQGIYYERFRKKDDTLQAQMIHHKEHGQTRARVFSENLVCLKHPNADE